MKISRNKTDCWSGIKREEGRSSLKLQVMDVSDVEEFEYFGSTIQCNGMETSTGRLTTGYRLDCIGGENLREYCVTRMHQ